MDRYKASRKRVGLERWRPPLADHLGGRGRAEVTEAIGPEQQAADMAVAVDRIERGVDALPVEPRGVSK